ncbi:MAG: hypothetical protein ACREVO_08130 [Steroidobacteraceae bacterium]
MGATGSLIELVGGAYAAGKTVTTGHGGMLAKAFGNSPPPGAPKPPLMVDQSQVTQGQTLEAAQAAALRQGRASTILTSNANTGDKLGP